MASCLSSFILQVCILYTCLSVHTLGQATVIQCCQKEVKVRADFVLEGFQNFLEILSDLSQFFQIPFQSFAVVL